MLFKNFIALIIASVLAAIAIAGVSIYASSTATNAQVPAQPVKQREYVNIGNGIRRTDDHEKGISCYIAAGGSMSCVKVSP